MMIYLFSRRKSGPKLGPTIATRVKKTSVAKNFSIVISVDQELAKFVCIKTGAFMATNQIFNLRR